jgi:hypothetical protein
MKLGPIVGVILSGFATASCTRGDETADGLVEGTYVFDCGDKSCKLTISRSIWYFWRNAKFDVDDCVFSADLKAEDSRYFGPVVTTGYWRPVGNQTLSVAPLRQGALNFKSDYGACDATVGVGEAYRSGTAIYSLRR